MRISSHQMFKLGIDIIQRQQAELSKTSLQLATGERILTPSDDPTGAVHSLELTTAIETTQQYQDNSVLAEARLNFEESILSDLGTSLQRVRELAVRGNNDSLTPEDRGFLAVEIRQHLEGLLTLANSRDANGEYIFAGSLSQTQPFSQTPPGFTYSGDALPRAIQISPVRQVPIGDAGDAVFMNILNGNGTFATQAGAANSGAGIIGPGTITDPTSWVADTYTIGFTAPDTYEVRDSGGTLVTSGAYLEGAAINFAGAQVSINGLPQTGDTFTVTPSVNQDIFQTYQNLIDALENPGVTDTDRAQFHTKMNSVLVDLDQAAENIFKTRADVGGRLNVLEGQRDVNEGTLLTLRETLSETRDLDYAEAISRLKLQAAGLQAAQQSYLQVQRLSLFDYLR